MKTKKEARRELSQFYNLKNMSQERVEKMIEEVTKEGVVKSYRMLELTTEQYEWLDVNETTAPMTAVSTGLDGSQGATDLHIFQRRDKKQTLVVPCGEYQNAEPWRFNAIVAPAFVLRHYLGIMRRAS